MCCFPFHIPTSSYMVSQGNSIPINHDFIGCFPNQTIKPLHGTLSTLKRFGLNLSLKGLSPHEATRRMPWCLVRGSRNFSSYSTQAGAHAPGRQGVARKCSHDSLTKPMKAADGGSVPSGFPDHDERRNLTHYSKALGCYTIFSFPCRVINKELINKEGRW